MSNTTYLPSWDSLDQRQTPAWFNQAKFGIFIHWGVFSVPAWRKVDNSLFGSYAEWYYASVYGSYRNNDDDFHAKHYGSDFLYRDFAPQFKAELFDADAWAALFKASGAKYVVMTTKHHDGYCMWPTTNAHKKNWNSADVGPQQDLLGAVTTAVRDSGLKMGIYYSIIDWETNWSHRAEGGYFVPEKDRLKFGIDEQRYPQEILLPQLKELVNTYQPCLIFSDGGEWDLSEEFSQTKEFLAWLYNDAPNRDEVLVNDRFFSGMPGNHGDYYSTEYNDKEGFGKTHPWEESRGIGKSYGFNRAEQLEDYCTSQQLVEQLIGIVSKGGNFLLNVGPTADGRIPTLQQERLRDIGRWMDVNGEAVYDSQIGGRLQSDDARCAFTRVAEADYLIVNKWLSEPLTLNLQAGYRPAVCQLLCKGEALEVPFSISDNTLTLQPLPYQFDRGLEYAFTYKFTA
ncbi:alpha-L-fucosidase [Erwinia sp. E602]|uniref:alpha-L-fucosidase n=1 Tax=unclassified Erwinia TaxID=2622719 RepID=UPI0006FED668|nr:MULTISPECIES: alpha-L-fucosidase [unclassified Erwinia]KQN64571.1 alpha-L-fucosidase [Erwinia sp. Leaf53]QUG74384.1 alpha-L-fucosidase [Erwinia sp. E602]